MKDCKHLITLFPHGLNPRVQEQFNQQGYTSISGGGNYSSKAFLIADLMREAKGVHNILWICSDVQHKEHVVRSISLWGDTHVYDFVQEENHLMDKKLGGINIGLGSYFFKVVLASLVMAQVVFLSWTSLPAGHDIVKFALTALSGAVSYFCLCYLLRVEQVEKGFRWILRKK